MSIKSCVHLGLSTCMPLCDGAMLEESCKEAVAYSSMQVAYSTPIQQYHRFLSTWDKIVQKYIANQSK